MKSMVTLLLISVFPLFGMAQGNAEILSDEDREKLAKAERAAINESDTIWKFGGTVGLNFSQSYFSNWAAGGQNSISGTALTSLFANYAKGRNSWNTTLDLAFGLLSQDDRSPIKTDDRIDLTSKYGYQTKNPDWYYSFLFNFRTQFAPGYTIEDGVELEPKISDFLAPAYSIVSLGFDYRPNENFSALLSPATSKITIVTVDELVENYGVDPGDNVRFEMGAFIKLAYQKDVFENVNLQTRLDLFSNYTENPQNIDVNWETLITMKVNKWLSATLTTQLLYDDDVLIVLDQTLDAEGTVISEAQSPKNAV